MCDMRGREDTEEDGEFQDEETLEGHGSSNRAVLSFLGCVATPMTVTGSMFGNAS